MVCESETRVISREIGRTPVAARSIAHAVPLPDLGLEDDDAAMRALEALQDTLAVRDRGVPCPFLSAQGDCSIYASRPLACRRLVHLDDDALLCRLVSETGLGTPVGPPTRDVRLDQAVDLQCMGPGQLLADLRDGFTATAPRGDSDNA